jgi:hypothetical protein
MNGKRFSNMDPCPDEETLRLYADGKIDDDAVESIVECHLEFCASCRAAVSRLRASKDNYDVQVKRIAKHLMERQAELDRNRARGPLPGTIWRAMPDDDDHLFGPLLLVLSADTERGEIKVAEVSEDLAQAGLSDLILQPQESGLRFVFMVRGSNTRIIPSGQLKVFAGRLNDQLTQDVVKFCTLHGSTTKAFPTVRLANSGTAPDGSLEKAGLSSVVRAHVMNSFTSAMARMAAVLAVVILLVESISAVAGTFLADIFALGGLLAGDIAARVAILSLEAPVTAWLLIGKVPLSITVGCYVLMTILVLGIARKTGINQWWLAFIPGGNLFLAIKMARISSWWLPVLLIPALWLRELHAIIFDSILPLAEILDKLILAMLFPWLWPIVLILSAATGAVSTGAFLVNGCLLAIFMLGWFLLSKGLVARRGKSFIWVLLLFFPLTAPIALVYLAFSD